MSKRSNPAFASGTSATVDTPPDANAAPPGDYMLFVLGDHRTPSEARIVRLQ